MKILKEKESPLFERRSLFLEIEFPKGPTPKIEDIKKQIASKFKVDEKLVSIKKTKTRFGGKKITVNCNIYTNDKIFNILEVRKKRKKKPKKKTEKKTK